MLSTTERQTAEARARALVRLLLVAALLGALAVAGCVSGIGAHLSTAEVRALVASGGPWGIALFVGLFTVGVFLHVPALVFVAAAVLAWGRLRGGLYAYSAALVATTASFVIVRTLGGQPLHLVRNRRVRALLLRIEGRPIMTVALLRALFLAAPAVTYALALSPIGAGPYLLGTAIGLVPSIAVLTSLFGVLFAG